MPFYNDAETAIELVGELKRILQVRGDSLHAVLVDDGSELPVGMPELVVADGDGTILHLRKNVGHQRAIATGLCWLSESKLAYDVGVVMDADGEDRPADVPRLIDAIGSAQADVAFAWRTLRAEGLRFRVGYQVYLLMHRVFLGTVAKVGNFSALSPRAIDAMVVDSDLWSHVAASIWKSKLPRVAVPTERGSRRRGESRLSWRGLVLHGLAAIATHREELALRFVVAGAVLVGVSLLGVVLALLGVPGFVLSWATVAAGSGLAMLAFASMHCFLILQGRSQATMLPLRDYHLFIARVRTFGCRAE